jgi:transmembrane sensor
MKIMEQDKHSVNDLFSKVLSGNATEQEKKTFKEWLEKSDSGKSAFQEYEKLWEASREGKKYDLEVARLKTKIKILEKLNSRRSFYFYWQRVAAILVIPLILAPSLYYLISSHKVASCNESIEYVKTSYGTRTSITLPDGSLVWLNSGSIISYPHNFIKSREVTLNGEIYLEVKKNSTPFIVRTKYGDIKVMGTKFNVAAYDSDQFRTSLYEGSVRLSSDCNKEEVVLKPGYQATLSSKGYDIRKLSNSDDISWKEGRLVFYREPFEIVAKKLERWFNVTIELKGERIKKLWYTGTIEMESFSEVLELIKTTTPIKYSYDSNKRVLTIISEI